MQSRLTKIEDGLEERAIVADNGVASAIQCGDGRVYGWKAAEAGFRLLPNSTLFRAAQLEDAVPADLKCEWPAPIQSSLTFEPDCDVIDHTDDQSSYLVQRGPADASVIFRDGPAYNLPFSDVVGTLIPHKARASGVLVADTLIHPAKLKIINLNNGQEESLNNFPSANLIFEDGAGQPEHILYSHLYGLFVVTFSGEFRVAKDMTYVRTYTEAGTPKWSIRYSLPSRTPDNLIVGDQTTLICLDGGRYGLLARTSKPYTARLIDLGDGSDRGEIKGWPIAASQDANTIVIRSETGDISLISITHVNTR